jgi:hypothetical protein
VEDKEFVHRFMELTAKRVNEKAKADGHELSSPITPDDINVRYEINAQIRAINPLGQWAPRIMRDLAEMDR